MHNKTPNPNRRRQGDSKLASRLVPSKRIARGKLLLGLGLTVVLCGGAALAALKGGGGEAAAIGSRRGGSSVPLAKTASSKRSLVGASTPKSVAPAQSPTPSLPNSTFEVAVWGQAIYPSSGHVKQGLVRLRVNNETQTAVTLVLIETENGQPVTNLNSAVQTLRADQIVQLAPGTYTYYEQSHPQAAGTLTVDP